MKLYYAPYTCSLSPHIVLRELELPFDLVKVNNQTKETSDGRDFRAINPKGYVAALELDNGQILTEGPAIVQYLADLRPDRKLAPANGTWERVRLQEWLNFITSEIHAGSAPLFNASLPEEAKTFFQEKLFKRFDVLETTLGKQDFLMGSSFSVADAYLFTVLSWCKFFNIDLSRWPAIAAYSKIVGKRPTVRQALQVEATA
ncbi:glutathione transferase GstA [Xanthomonas axonopodis]|uniref:glutathione transferase GstA n=1 Tax=Xanthomonas axonopodis TaxID=53413 RepID=UPI0009982717|nr:glutathione transferase GstA [Xanthomonas axonopodis]OOX21890.1 glutathione S-transferase [Xanthomonas axonopodis pv. bauhiniae]